METKNKKGGGKKVFVTSALPYVNNQPHLGNIIGSLLSADVYARFGKNMGYDLKFICGTDEYGTATEMEAMKQGRKPIEIVEENRIKHKKVYDWFGIEFDFWGNTRCEEHDKLVQEIFLRTIDYFEERDIKMFHCNKCEQFLADRYVEGTCKCGARANGDQCDDCGNTFEPEELKDVECKLCKNEPQLKKVTHLFLRLDLLKSYVEKINTEGWSENAKDIYKNWLKMDIEPRCFTRKLKYNWGVPVPLKKFSDLVFYVWFDAPIGYLTFLKQSLDNSNEKIDEFLKSGSWVQFMGKDNVPFHSITFPSVLYAWKENKLRSGKKYSQENIMEKLEEINLKGNKDMIGEMHCTLYKDEIKIDKNFDLDHKTIISATEYLTYNKKKFSKSKKIGIFGLDLVENKLGDSSKWRFYLLKRRPETKDTDFSTSEFLQLVDSELIGNLGNFINRTLKFLEKKKVGIKKEQENINEGFKTKVDAFYEEVEKSYKEYKEEMDKIHLRAGINKVLEISAVGNKFLQELQNNKENMISGFAIAYDLVVLLGQLFEPFMPAATEKLKQIVEIKSDLYETFKDLVRDSKKEILGTVEVVFTKFSDAEKEELGQFK